ncbi:MAG: F0F1 ATP synthase subunit A [bacterium]|nr:F0F1 ATP synthase subunit A [bacterium]
MHIVPEVFEFEFLPRSLVMSVISWFIIIGIFITSKFIYNFRLILEYIYESINRICIEIIETEKYTPLFYVLFLYLLISNIIGLIPPFTSPTATLENNLACAIFVFLFYNYIGIKKLGVKYIKHFTGPKIYLAPLMLPIELISHIVRPFSLTMRLFGNIFAKEVVLGILGVLFINFIGLPGVLKALSLAPLIIRPLVVVLGFLVSIIQAGVFTILSIIYLSGAIHEE